MVEYTHCMCAQSLTLQTPTLVLQGLSMPWYDHYNAKKNDLYPKGLVLC